MRFKDQATTVRAGRIAMVVTRLKIQDKEVRIVHDDENWWSLQLNTHNSGAIDVGFYTVRFDSLYFKQYATDCLEEEEELQELVENHPHYCSVEEAMEHHCWMSDIQARAYIENQQETLFI